MWFAVKIERFEQKAASETRFDTHTASKKKNVRTSTGKAAAIFSSAIQRSDAGKAYGSKFGFCQFGVMTMTDTNKECTKPTNRLFYHMRNNFPYVPALLTTMPYLYFIDLFLIFLLCCCSIYGVQLREDERRIMYNTRGYEWPLPGVIPNTPGWNRLMRRRMAQVQQLPDIRDRYTGWVGVITQAIVAPNFTENGFRVAKAPSHVVDLLKKSITNNIHNATKEYLYDHIDGNSPRWDSPLVMHDQAVSQLVIEKLQPLLEEWVGIKLIGKIAYGPRIYRNESILHMHGEYRSLLEIQRREVISNLF